jgi:integrase
LIPVVLDEEREKDFLTEPEMTRLLKGAGSNRHNLRDVAMLRMIYDHGLRLTEAISLRWSTPLTSTLRFPNIYQTGALL